MVVFTTGRNLRELCGHALFQDLQVLCLSKELLEAPVLVWPSDHRAAELRGSVGLWGQAGPTGDRAATDVSPSQAGNRNSVSIVTN